MSKIKIFFGGLIFLCILSSLTDRSKIEQMVDRLEAELCDVKDKCDELQSTVDDLESKVDDLEFKVNDLEWDLQY
jgi:outer membrane murein-binding lipoprotein Lpp